MTDMISDTARLYELLDSLAARIGGFRFLEDCYRAMNLPQRGVYFFYEYGEYRTGLDTSKRVVRVGTHGLKTGSSRSLRNRLYSHRGSLTSGRGNHRGSIFRLLLGQALARQNGHAVPRSWGIGKSAAEAARKLQIGRLEILEDEMELEGLVNKYVRQMPFLVLNVDDAPGPCSRRGFIERNCIALLSNYRRPAADQPSRDWAGRYSGRPRVRCSGLWNSNHVDQGYNPSFLDEMEHWIRRTTD